MAQHIVLTTDNPIQGIVSGPILLDQTQFISHHDSEQARICMKLLVGYCATIMTM